MSVATRLRLSMIDGPELRCAHCGEWWALTTEFWKPPEFSMCRVCWNDRAKLYQAIRRMDPTFRDMEVARGRKYIVRLRREHPEYARAYHREIVARARERARQKAAA